MGNDKNYLTERMRSAVLDAGKLAMRHFGKVRVELKADDSVVTEADREIDAFLRERARAILPEAVYIGEESSGDDATKREAERSEWVWVVDPIDGTAAFADGIETFCVSMGLMRDGEPYAGAVCLPAVNHMYEGVAGGGARYDGKPIRAPSAMPVADRAVLYADSNVHLAYRVTFPGKVRGLGSAALHYLLVARGAAVGAVSHARIWDCIGAAVIVREAGGTVRHLDGREIDWRRYLDGSNIYPPVLAAPRALWDWVAGTIRFLDSSECVVSEWP